MRDQPLRPDVPPGTLIVLEEGEWQYGTGALLMAVERVRWDLAWCYGGERVWIEGLRLSDFGDPLGWVQALIRTAVLPPQTPDRVPAPRPRHASPPRPKHGSPSRPRLGSPAGEQPRIRVGHVVDRHGTLHDEPSF